MITTSTLSSRIIITVAALLFSALNLSFLAVPLEDGGSIRVETIA